MVQRTDNHEHWIVWDSIKEEAEKLRSENVGEEPILKLDEQGKPIPDNFVIQVLKKHIDELVAKKPIGELIFGPGIPLTESKEIRIYARSLNLKTDIKQYQGEQYLSMYENFKYPDLVEVLKERKMYGKFELVDRSELPTHASVEKDIPKVSKEEET